MARTKKSTQRSRHRLKRHYQKNFKAAVECLGDDLPVEEFCWMELSWRTARMIADIGEEGAAQMFEEWAKLIREGRFGDFDASHMSSPDDLEESLIY